MKVSIIMPAYNCCKTIGLSIESVINQSYQNWELLITDDFSTDSTKDIITNYQKKDSRIKLLKNTYDKGVSGARNTSIHYADGAFIAFLDTDDTWNSNKLEEQLKAMNDSGTFASHSGYERRDYTGALLSTIYAQKVVTFDDMLKKNCIANLTGIYNSDVLGKFFQKKIGHEDYEMWLRILVKTDSIGIRMSLANYTVSQASVSSRKLVAAKWHFDILANEIKLPLYKATFYFCFYFYNSINKRLKEKLLNIFK
ncbi:glycosyl transferase [Photobacterium phosphoreum]|uniref:glycosyltransferase family 2 protein n=1 Tax=Photobacterium phosphoreum TaxID=659 RepID=UPI000D16E67E|nr:glycosyltransferase family 2 protein [Photobacterium phosphoreum]PSU62253.1 glycosyl transferase [Photobacterium phosphoreum]PSW09953.1 glycosyl transferase [Photobacterium phosphoreum]